MVTKSKVYVTLSDLQVLDCKVCNQPLTIPVFQCKNGHTACKSCCESLDRKCASCGLAIDSKCCHLEEIIQSHKLPCHNKDYGCEELISYFNTKEHAENCIYERYPCPNKDNGCTELINCFNSKIHVKDCFYELYPCPGSSCSGSACPFKGTSSDLSIHFFAKHYYKNFDYSMAFNLELGKNQKVFVLNERQSSDLFVLNNEASTCGGTKIIVSFVSLSPPMSRSQVVVEVLGAGSNVIRFCCPAPTARSISHKLHSRALLISGESLGLKDSFWVNLTISAPTY